MFRADDIKTAMTFVMQTETEKDSTFRLWNCRCENKLRPHEIKKLVSVTAHMPSFSFSRYF